MVGQKKKRATHFATGFGSICFWNAAYVAMHATANTTGKVAACVAPLRNAKGAGAKRRSPAGAHRGAFAAKQVDCC